MLMVPSGQAAAVVLHKKLCYTGHTRLHALKYQQAVATDGIILCVYGFFRGHLEGEQPAIFAAACSGT